MSDWFRATEESLRALSEERLLVAATELVSEALERSGETRSDLAQKLSISKSEISQRLGGRRNLTLRSFAAMLHELGYEAHLEIRPCRATDGNDVRVSSSQRTSDWPAANMMYTTQRASLRVIQGGQAA